MTTERWPLPWHSEGENTLERCPRCREMDIYFHAKFSHVDIFFFSQSNKTWRVRGPVCSRHSTDWTKTFLCPTCLFTCEKIDPMISKVTSHTCLLCPLYTHSLHKLNYQENTKKKSIIQYMILNFREFRYKYWLTSILYKMWKPLEECFESKPWCVYCYMSSLGFQFVRGLEWM